MEVLEKERGFQSDLAAARKQPQDNRAQSGQNREGN